MSSASRKKKRRLPVWTHGPLFAALRGVIAGCRLAGIERSSRVLRRVGGRFARLASNRERLQRAISNIAWAFPERGEAECEALAVEAYRHLLGLASEMAVVPELLTRENWPDYITLSDYEPVINAMDSDQPAILITGHCGNWELMAHVMAMLGYPMHALYRPLDMKPLNDWVVKTRAMHGIELIDKFGGSTRLPALMEAGESLGFVADQNAGDRGLFVPFFDRLASSYKSIGLLALRYDAKILCGRSQRIGETDGSAPYFRYELHLQDQFGPEDWSDQPDPLFYITARYRRAIEGMVRHRPAQYLWMHRYWKSRPRHEREKREFPRKLRANIESLPWMTQASLDRILARSERDAREFVPKRPRG